uniref:AIPP2-like SPOC-like domain-containing protein n=1 Tax=Oryza brachyantha TaxID=4533 RepID=J3NBL2_ORYBR
MICSMVINSSQLKFGPSERRITSRFKSSRMIRIAKEHARTQRYMQRPKERTNSNVNITNVDTNTTKTSGVKKYGSSKVSTKEASKTFERNISQVSNKPMNFSGSCNAKVNSAYESSEVLASTSRIAHAYSITSETLPRDARDGLSDQNHGTLALEHMKKINLHKENLEGCVQQGRIPKSLLGEGDDANGSTSKQKMGQMLKKRKTIANDDNEDLEHLTSNDSTLKKKWREFDANEVVDVGSQNARHIKDCVPEVELTISKAIKWHCSLPVDEPIWRPDESFNQLVKEAMENDLAFCAVIDKTEMLIFHSIMLPRQYQTFQGKHYLWGLFRPRKDIVGLAEEQAANARSSMEHGMGLENQEGFKGGAEQVESSHVPNHSMDSEPKDPKVPKEEQAAHAVSSTDYAERSDNREGFKDGTEQVEFGRVLVPSMDIEPQDPEGAETRDTSDQNSVPTLGGSRANQPSVAATVPANQEQIDSSSRISPGSGWMFAFVAQPSPRFLELMQELEREGATIATMPRVTARPGQGQGQATARE